MNGNGYGCESINAPAYCVFHNCCNGLRWGRLLWQPAILFTRSVGCFGAPPRRRPCVPAGDPRSAGPDGRHSLRPHDALVPRGGRRRDHRVARPRYPGWRCDGPQPHGRSLERPWSCALGSRDRTQCAGRADYYTRSSTRRCSRGSVHDGEHRGRCRVRGRRKVRWRQSFQSSEGYLTSLCVQGDSLLGAGSFMSSFRAGSRTFSSPLGGDGNSRAASTEPMRSTDGLHG